jgi:hypothetical protein
VWVFLFILLLVIAVAAFFWRQHQAGVRKERERKERRARTDKLLARVLLGDEADAPHPMRREVARPEPEAAPEAPATGAPVGPSVVPGVPGPAINIDLLLGDESTTVAEQARLQLGRPTTRLSSFGSESTLPHTEGDARPAHLSLLEGRMDASLDALVLAWFSARGYVVSRAPEGAEPLRLLLTHADDAERSYAFYFERGRLHAQRAAALLEKAQSLGMNRLLVAAEHGADPAVSSARLRDVLVMDWVALDREFKRIDFRVAAKLIAIARSRRDLLGLA